MQFSAAGNIVRPNSSNVIIVGLGLFVGCVPVAFPLAYIEPEIPDVEMMDVDAVRPRRVRTLDVDIIRPRLRTRVVAVQKVKHHHTARFRLDKQRPKRKAKNARSFTNENHAPYKDRLGIRMGLKTKDALAKSLFLRTFSVTDPINWTPSVDIYDGNVPGFPMEVDDIYYRLPRMPNFTIEDSTPPSVEVESTSVSSLGRISINIYPSPTSSNPVPSNTAILQADIMHHQIHRSTETTRRRERRLKVRKRQQLKRGERRSTPVSEVLSEVAVLDDEPVRRQGNLGGATCKVEDVNGVRPEEIENHLEMMELHKQLLEALWNDGHVGALHD